VLDKVLIEKKLRRIGDFVRELEEGLVAKTESTAVIEARRQIDVRTDRVSGLDARPCRQKAEMEY